MEFSLTLTDSDPSSTEKFPIDLSGNDMLVDGLEIDPSGGRNSCYIPIMKQEFTGDSKTIGTKVYQDTWLLGTHVMNKYYTIFDESRGYTTPRVAIALKDPNMQKE